MIEKKRSKIIDAQDAFCGAKGHIKSSKRSAS